MFHINICRLAHAPCEIAEDQGRLGPKRGRKCYVTAAFSGIPKQRRTKLEVQTSTRGHHDAPRAPSITKYGSLVRPGAQIVALRAHCARSALKAPPQALEASLLSHHYPVYRPRPPKSSFSSHHYPVSRTRAPDSNLLSHHCPVYGPRPPRSSLLSHHSPVYKTRPPESSLLSHHCPVFRTQLPESNLLSHQGPVSPTRPRESSLLS